MDRANVNAFTALGAFVESRSFFRMARVDLHFANCVATSAMNAILLDALMLVHGWLKGFIPCYAQ